MVKNNKNRVTDFTEQNDHELANRALVYTGKHCRGYIALS